MRKLGVRERTNDLLLEAYESVRKFHRIVAECSVQLSFFMKTQEKLVDQLSDQFVSDFMEDFLVKAFVADILDEDFLQNCIFLFSSIASLPEIPNKSTFKEKSTSHHEKLNVSEDFIETVKKFSKVIMKSASKGFKFQTVDKAIAVELAKACGDFSTTFILEGWNNLKVYHNFST